MEFTNSLNPNTLPSEVCEATNFLVNYYQNVHKYPVQSQVEPGYLREILPNNAPQFPESLESIIEDIDTKIVPGLTHWQSPSFFAYFPANASNAGLLGEMLCSGLNVVGFNWISSPAATELETIVIDWLGKLLKLPQEFPFSGGCGGGGVIYGNTCEAVVCTLAAARDRALNSIGEDKISKLVVYASDQTHFCFQKAAKLVGIPPRNFRALATTIDTGFALLPETLRAAMEEDVANEMVPLYVGATIGATSSGAVDPIFGLGHVATDFGAWLHIDAAYAGSACICPENQHYLNGVELANSISMNPQKWVLTNLDCACLWLKEPTALVDSLSSKPEYLKNKASLLGEVIDYKDWQISLGRRFRALKLWIVLRRYGSNNLMDHIRNGINLAEFFESLVNKDNRFEVVFPRKFSLVCFRLSPHHREDGVESLEANAKTNQRLLEAVNTSGRAYMTHSIIGGIFVLRCAVGGTLTKKCHVDELWSLIQEKVEIILSK